MFYLLLQISTSVIPWLDLCNFYLWINKWLMKNKLLHFPVLYLSNDVIVSANEFS